MVTLPEDCRECGATALLSAGGNRVLMMDMWKVYAEKKQDVPRLWNPCAECKTAEKRYLRCACCGARITKKYKGEALCWDCQGIGYYLSGEIPAYPPPGFFEHRDAALTALEVRRIKNNYYEVAQ